MASLLVASAFIRKTGPDLSKTTQETSISPQPKDETTEISSDGLKTAVYTKKTPTDFPAELLLNVKNIESGVKTYVDKTDSTASWSVDFVASVSTEAEFTAYEKYFKENNFTITNRDAKKGILYARKTAEVEWPAKDISVVISKDQTGKVAVHISYTVFGIYSFNDAHSEKITQNYYGENLLQYIGISTVRASALLAGRTFQTSGQITGGGIEMYIGNTLYGGMTTNAGAGNEDCFYNAGLTSTAVPSGYVAVGASAGATDSCYRYLSITARPLNDACQLGTSQTYQLVGKGNSEASGSVSSGQVATSIIQNANSSNNVTSVTVSGGTIGSDCTGVSKVVTGWGAVLDESGDDGTVNEIATVVRTGHILVQTKENGDAFKSGDAQPFTVSGPDGTTPFKSITGSWMSSDTNVPAGSYTITFNSKYDGKILKDVTGETIKFQSSVGAPAGSCGGNTCVMTPGSYILFVGNYEGAPGAFGSSIGVTPQCSGLNPYNNITWAPPSSPKADSQYVRWCSGSGCNPDSGPIICSGLSGNASACAHTGLTSGTFYRYRIFAQNSAGTTKSTGIGQGIAATCETPAPTPTSTFSPTPTPTGTPTSTPTPTPTPTATPTPASAEDHILISVGGPPVTPTPTPSPGLTITCSPPNATMLLNQSKLFTASGGDGNYTWSLTGSGCFVSTTVGSTTEVSCNVPGVKLLTASDQSDSVPGVCILNILDFGIIEH